ncbi:MAG: TetR/AcrR family transcriptional regulator [Chitinophagaceae bacterium]
MKERIQQKAEELFHRYGIRSITMDEIAGQLGISKKTIYHFFADKEELVFAVFNKYMAESKQRCLADRTKALDAIHEIFLDLDMIEEMLQTMNPYILYDLEKYHPNVFKKFYEYKNEFLYKLVLENLKRGIREDIYREDIDVEIMSRFRIGTMLIAVNTDIFPKNKFNFLQVEQAIIIHFIYGIATSKGIKLIQKYDLQRKKNKSLAV